jgi:hypothetical protein
VDGETIEVNVASLGQSVTNYFYFDKQLNEAAVDANDIQYEYYGTTNSADYSVLYEETALKRKAISIKESNRFNIIQTIAQTFECWPRFKIATEIKEENGIRICRQTKNLAFVDKVGEINNAGFIYGVNLKNIKRTFDSKNVVSKLIVKPNSNKYAHNGFCTIARANSNPLKDNTLYDFTYYIKKGIIQAEDLQSLLY